MTLLTNLSSVQYLGTGSTGPFAYPFRVTQSAFFFVTTTDLSGNVTQLTYGTDYTVTGIGARNGGSLTLTNALTAGWTLTISRVLPQLQTTNLRSQGQILPGTVEDTFDYQMGVIQQLGGGSGQFAAFDEFEHGVDFTAGTTTQLTLKQLPAMVGGLTVTFDSGAGGIVQHHSKYTVAGRVVTFTNPIPVGVLEVQAQYYGLTNFNQIASSGGGGGSSSSVELSVMDHGAKGDGVTDDTAAFNATIALLPSTGGTVVAPAGTYLINGDYNGGQSVRLVSNMTLRLAAGCTLKVNGSATSNLAAVFADSVSNVSVIGPGVIDGNKAAQSGASAFGMGIQFQKVTDGQIQNVRIKNCHGDGIYLTTSGTVVSGHECVRIGISGVSSVGCYRNGMSITAAIGVRIVNCEFSSVNGTAPEAGIDLEQNAGTAVVEDVAIIGCIFESNTQYGIQWAASTDCVAIGCVARGCGVAGFFVAQVPVRAQIIGCHAVQSSATSAGILLDFSQGTLVSGCHVAGTFLQGIWSRGGATPTTNGKNDIIGCTVVGDASTANQIGIAGSNGADRTSIVGGSVTSCAFGVQLASCDWSTVVGITARANTTYGIEISTCQYTRVSGCVAEGNTLVGIIFDDNSVFCSAVGNHAQGNGTIGIETAVGSDDCMVANNVCLENSQTTTATSDNILLGGNRGLCIGNQVRIGNKTNQPRYGIQVAAGTANAVLNNDVTTGGATGLIHDAGTSTSIRGNPGFNPVGWTTPGVGASPATVTNITASPVLAYVIKGTVSDVTHSVGGTISGATNVQAILQPGESLVITYAVGPTVEFQGI